jgi:hypothetical protein
MADPHRLDEVVITAPKSVGELISGNEGPPPPPVIVDVGLPATTAERKISDGLKALISAYCKRATESQEDWFIRALQTWRNERPFDGFLIAGVRTMFGADAALGQLSPAPVNCPV